MIVPEQFMGNVIGDLSSRRGKILGMQPRTGQQAVEAEVPLGEMDVTLYRDDLNTLLPDGKVDHTRIPFDINNKAIILVDDVLNTGRTVRAAVDHLIDLGRPRMIQLAVLIDRGGREFPISANFVAKRIKPPAQGEIKVRLKEVDNLDSVVIVE